MFLSIKDEKIKNKVYFCLWVIYGCPTHQHPDRMKRKISHPNFGCVAFLNDASATIRPSEKKKGLALELAARSPLLLLESMLQMTEEEKLDELESLYVLLPLKIRSELKGNMWIAMGSCQEHTPDIVEKNSLLKSRIEKIITS